LMIVVAIIGILAAVAVPAFMRYVRRSKTGEAAMNIRKLVDSSTTYFMAEHVTSTGSLLARYFPGTAPASPSTSGSPGPCCPNKCSPSTTLWTNETWVALNFSVDDPFYFSYQYNSSASNAAATFTASAFGDLNCDGTYSTFQRMGTVDNAM